MWIIVNQNCLLSWTKLLVKNVTGKDKSNDQSKTHKEARNRQIDKLKHAKEARSGQILQI